MSTPTTATALLPPTHYRLHPPYSSNYRTTTTANSLLPTTAVVDHQPALQSPARPQSYYYHHQPAANAGYSLTDGVAQSSQPVPRPPHGHYSHQDSNPSATARFDDSYTSTMPNTTTTSSGVVPAAGRPVAEDQPSRKRRRSREPDWNNFYRNGLPKEIIVIDDTPEPEANTGRKITNGNTIVPDSAAAAAAQQAAKKRRRDDPPLGYHVQYLGGSHTGSHTNTPLPNAATPAGSTLSSDRTNSALNTTAPTSLSSNSQYDELAAPLKRKRTTRQQAANEAKRRDVDGLGGAYMAYKPPPYPPKKSAEVPVRVIHDVSLNLYGLFFCLRLRRAKKWFDEESPPANSFSPHHSVTTAKMPRLMMMMATTSSSQMLNLLKSVRINRTSSSPIRPLTANTIVSRPDCPSPWSGYLW